MDIQETNLTNIANAIRNVEGSSDTIPANTFANRINALQTSGGGVSIPLTVTVDEGSTVTAVNGDTTITGISDSSGQVTLMLTALGTWTVSATKDGETSNSKTINVPENTLILEFVKGPAITQITGPISGFTHIAYCKNRFIASPYTANGKIYYSTDGSTWITSSVPLSSVTFKIILYGNSKYILKGKTGAAALYSTNGTSWSASSFPTSTSTYCGCFGKGKFVILGYDGSSYSSTNGSTWESSSQPNSGMWYDIAYDSDKFVALNYKTIYSAYSQNGTSWSTMNMPKSAYSSIAYGSDKFVAVSAHSSMDYVELAYSMDGINWNNASNIPITAEGACIAYGNGYFVIVFYNSNIMAYSIDGINWKTTTLPISKKWNSIACDNEKFLVVSEDSNTILTLTF